MTQEIEEQEEMIRLQRYLLYIRNNSVKNLILTVGRTVWYKGQMKMQKIHDDHRDSSKLYKSIGSYSPFIWENILRAFA